MKVLLSVSVLTLSLIFFLTNLYKTFPFGENFSKIHYVGFNAHHLYYITTISENIAESLRLPKTFQSECIFEECKKLYQHNPSAFWIALIFSLIPKDNHKLAFAILNIASAIAVFVFSIIFSFTRSKILLLLITPYISSLIARFMMTGGIVVHLIPSLLFILGWIKLKKFEEEKSNFRIFVSSALICIACFMNIMFIIPASILYFAYANQIRGKIIIPAFTVLTISPFYLIYFYQHRICVPNEWRDIVAYDLFGRQFNIGFIYSIKLIFNHSPIVPVLMLLSLILIIKPVFDKKKDKDLKDSVISAFILFGIFSPLIPGIISKGFFFPRFEMIPTFIMLHTIYIRFNKTKWFSLIVIAFSIFSAIQAFQIQNKIFTFKNFEYYTLDELFREIRSKDQINFLIETVELPYLISEDTYLVLLETNKKAYGLFWDSSSLLLKKNQLIYQCKDKIISEKETENIKETMKNLQISYIVCKTSRCSKFFGTFCKQDQKITVKSIPISYRFFRCEL